jgi:hypothetical protein
MLVPNAPDKPKSQIKFVKNDKWKTVTMLIFASLDEDCINDGRQYIDRTSLYALSNSYVYDPLTCQPIIATDGSYEYRNGIMQGAISIQSSSSSGGSYQIIGQTDINGNATRFTQDIIIGLDGQYTPIRFQIGGDVYEISQISQVINDFTLIAGDVTLNGSTITLPSSGVSTSALKQAVYVTVGGGAGAFVKVLDSVSFAEIANQVNVGSPDIIYETIQENGEPVRNQDGTLSQTFSIELRAQDDIIKSVYLGVLPDPNKPTIFNLVNVIGYDLSLQTSPRITPIARHSNYYEPYARDLFFFRDPYLGIDFNSPTGNTGTGGTGSTGGGIPDEDYKLRVLALMRYKNTQFYSAHLGFGQIERMFYHKVNVEDASSVLELSQDSAFLSLYPLINEVGIAYRDFYAFSSNWEPGYFRKSIDKTQVQSVIGTRSMLEKKSFFGSKYLKVPSEILLETFIPSLFNEDAIADPSLIPGDFMYVENQSAVQFYLFIQKRLIQELAPSIKATLQQYVNPLYGFGSEETIDDDVSQYIIQNLLQLYKVDRIELFVKQSRLEQPNDYTTATLSNEEKVIAGLRLTDAFSSRLLNTNQFDTRLIYNRRLGFSESFGFNIVIVKK